MKDLNQYQSVVMLISFYCAIIKQSIGCNPLIAKQHSTRIYLAIIYVYNNITHLPEDCKIHKIKVAKKLSQLFFTYSILLLYVIISPATTVFTIRYKRHTYIHIYIHFANMFLYPMRMPSMHHVYHVPKCISFLKAIVNITERAHCFRDYICVMPILLQ